MKPSEAALFASWEKSERPYPWNETQFGETLLSTTQMTLVLDQEEEPVGYGVLQMVEGESYLLNIMVRSDCRQKGVGETLLRKLLSWSKDGGATHMFLDVDPENTPAVALYQKCGFQIFGRRPKAYPRGESSQLLKKDLS
jgi:ribosomal-protein-alanine N-acetyltransferase